EVGPSPREWWGMVRTAHDDGATWSEARRLPDGVLGPIKNKPVLLANGTILSPRSTESLAQPSGWRRHIEPPTDNGRTWTIVRPSAASAGPEPDAIQPSILVYWDG